MVGKETTTMAGYGIHVIKGKHKSILDACMSALDEFQSPVMQIFTGVPRMTRLVAMKEKEFSDFVNANELRVYGHSSYMTSVWGPLDDAYVKKVKFFAEQCVRTVNAGLRGMVVHVPKLEATVISDSLGAVMKYLAKEKGITAPILLEHKPLIPDAMSLESAQKINKLMELVTKSGINARFTIDTGHVFAGKVKIKTYEQASKFINSITDYRWIGLLHLNGNAVGDRQFRDEHAVPMSKRDKIWGGMAFEDSGLHAFLDWGKRYGVDAIYETHNPDEEHDDIVELFETTGYLA